MSDRISHMTENRLTKMITDLQSDVIAFKNAQRISGQSGVLGFFSQSSATWDLTNTVGTNSDTSSITTIVNINFVGDGSQVVTMANIGALIYVNGTDVAHQLTPAVLSWTDGTRSASIQFQGLSITRNSYVQTIQLTTLKQVTYYFKGSAVASCRGTVTVST